MSIEQKNDELAKNQNSEAGNAFVAVPATTASALYGSTLRENWGLSLSTSAWLLAAARRPDGSSTEYVALINHPLDSRKLLQLLTTLAPSRSFAATRYAVIADWEMPDMDFPSAQRLQQRHTEGLGSHWHDFNQHRPSLLHTLRHDREAIEGMLARMWTSAWARSRLIQKATGMSLDHSWGFFSRDEGGQRMKQLMLEIIRARQQARRKTSHPALPDTEVIRRFVRWRPQQKRTLAGDVLSALPVNLQGQLIAAHARLYGRQVVKEDEPIGEVVYDRDDIVVRSLGTGRLSVAVGSGLYAEAYLAVDKEGVESWRLAPATVENKNVLIPLLRWRKGSTGQRSWQLVSVDATLATRWLHQNDTLPPPREGHVIRWNSVLGPLIVAYLDPSLRRDWPERQGLPGGEFLQPMGPAQVPVLALQHRETLLESGLIVAIEHYIDQHLGS